MNVSGFLDPVDVKPTEAYTANRMSERKLKRPFNLPHAPVFYPTAQEFKDPHSYIRKIAEECKSVGILKIVPPKDWSTDFVVDPRSFKFRTRKQTLSSMGAVTRTSIDWVNRMSVYHKQKGTQETFPKFPKVGYGVLCYYKLQSLVEKNGGFAHVCEEKLWPSIAAQLEMGTLADYDTAEEIYSLYAKWVLPFMHYTGSAVNYLAAKSHKNQQKLEEDMPPTPDSIAYNVKQTPRSTRSVSPGSLSQSGCNFFWQTTRDGKIIHMRKVKDEDVTEADSIFKRQSLLELQDKAYDHRELSFERQNKHNTEQNNNYNSLLLSPATIDDNKKRDRVAMGMGMGSTSRKRQKVTKNDDEGDADYSCESCRRNTDEDDYQCTECYSCYHEHCLPIDLALVKPQGATKRRTRWWCPSCIVGNGDFFFDVGREYTLQRFQKFANTFKRNYLRSHLPMVDPNEKEVVDALLEHRFWQHVEDYKSRLSVEYGADINCMEKGSAFPEKSEDPWNLNTMPKDKSSYLHYLQEEISGVSLPWAYVGMVFSAFCWHSEDHYTYSINYQHVGDTKIWYGIPGHQAEQFESESLQLVPDLFQKQPDLLFQRATMVNPNYLAKRGINVHVVDQRPGEFVVTLPKVYHAGVNLGFNFNEAVNYAPKEWLKYGREAERSYKFQKRNPLFSHDALLYKAARDEVDHGLDNSSIATIAALRPLFIEMAERELYMRKKVSRNLLKTVFLNVHDWDSEEQCSECNCFCFLSFLSLGDKVYCFDHVPNSLNVKLNIRIRSEDLKGIVHEISMSD